MVGCVGTSCSFERPLGNVSKQVVGLKTKSRTVFFSLKGWQD